VKSRKEKRQTAKPKPKVQHRDEPRASDKNGSVPRPASFRGGIRGGAPRGGRSTHSSAGGRAKPAAPAAAPAAGASDGSGWDLSAADSSNVDSWGSEAAPSAEKPVAKPTSKPAAAAAAPVAEAAAPAKAPSMSWANIAKR
ncbi:hypothetical protein IWQ57_006975, partial [Coemansia nantahalensis]